MARFFIDQNDIQNTSILLTGENAAHAKVLRLKPGEEVYACDCNGVDYLCSVLETDPNKTVLKIISKDASKTEPAIRATIYMALPKADKLEHVIQKATELGAYEIVTFPSARCISKPDEKGLNKKLERWQKIALSAAEQCGRGRIPQVRVLSSYKAALTDAAKADKAILFYENEHATTLHMALSQGQFQSISLMTGPEGGLEPSEVQLAEEYGLQVCTLGTRILRCETAPLCAISAVMYAAGEF